jgi:hypothetical protein
MTAGTIVLILLLTLAGCGGGGGGAAASSVPGPTVAAPEAAVAVAATPTPTPPATTAPASDLAFVADDGLRMDNASNAAAGVDPASGTVYLYYEDRVGQHSQKVATSSDGLAFGVGSTPLDARFDSRNVRLPDGSWRRYQYHPDTRELGSTRSTDGIDFTPEDGVRYSPAPSDNGEFGVYDLFSDPSGAVVMLYVGDLHGRNNVREAVSSDNGLTFTFSRGNVLGDDDAGGGGRSFVDPKTIALPDGRRRLFVNRGGTLYSFTSDASLRSYVQDPGIRLQPSDIHALTVTAFYDPVCVRLPDGRYRLYFTAQLSEPVGKRAPPRQAETGAKQPPEWSKTAYAASPLPDHQALMSATTR